MQLRSHHSRGKTNEKEMMMRMRPSGKKRKSSNLGHPADKAAPPGKSSPKKVASSTSSSSSNSKRPPMPPKGAKTTFYMTGKIHRSDTG